MSQTLIPRAINAGCRVLTSAKVERFLIRDRLAKEAIVSHESRKVTIQFKDLFVSAGAIYTPYLLRRSGIVRNIGNTLCMHPMVRVAALFDDAINDDEGVPTVQVEEFKPRLTLGCSCSSKAHLALWLSGTADEKREKLKLWKNMAVYYAAISAKGSGKVRSLPLIHEPFVSYRLEKEDVQALHTGLYQLATLLFAAGAKELFFPIDGLKTVTSLDDLKNLSSIPSTKMNMTTIHLFSSCPMGENRKIAAVDSFGKLFDCDNIYINDASILPECPGVNPQASIMAIARRNAAHYLKTRS